MAKTDTLNFEDAFHYPFKRAVGLLNILWFLLPIIGWFPLIGYTIKIKQQFIEGQFKELPLFNFTEHFKFGFVMFLKSLPFAFAYGIFSIIILMIPFIGFLISIFVSLFIVPVLVMNFFKHETVDSYFEFSLVEVVFQNFEDYLIALLKTIGLGIIFLFMMIVLVGWPAGAFTKNIFLADFYGRVVSGRKSINKKRKVSKKKNGKK